jgi:spore germination protein
MMIVDREKIGTGAALLLVTLIGLDFLDIPYNAAKIGPSGYWSILISYGLIVPLIHLISAFSRRFPNSNLLQVAPKVLGPIPALVGNLIFISLYLLWLVFAIRDSADLVVIYMLNRTPIWVVTTLFLTGVGYVVSGGIKSVACLASFVLIPIFGLRVIMQLIAFQRLVPSHLMPVFSEPGIDYLVGGLKLVGYFSPVISFFLIHPYLGKEKKITRVLFGTTLAVLLIFIMAIIGSIGVFGAAYTQHFSWPEINALNRIDIPILALEQAGLLFLIVWLTSFFVSCSFYVYLVVQGLTEQFPVLKRRWILPATLVFIGVVGLLAPNSQLVHTYFTSIRVWAIVPWICYPAIIYIVAVLRKVGDC